MGPNRARVGACDEIRRCHFWDELADGALLFQLISKLCRKDQADVTTNLPFSEWVKGSADAKMSTAQHCSTALRTAATKRR